MGLVELPFIYQVMKSKQAGNERPTFLITVTMYKDKKREEKPKRNLFFSCDTEEERDKWIFAIDYLKTRAIYEAYAKKNTLANFISTNKPEETKHDEDGGDRDHSDLLYDFGEHLRTMTTNRAASVGLAHRALSSNNMSVLGRKSSVIKPQVEMKNLSAPDLVEKLKLLYKLGMTSFLHHLDQRHFKTKAVIAKTASGKQGQAQEPMQFPAQLYSWAYTDEIEEANASVERVKNTTGGSVKSGGSG